MREKVEREGVGRFGESSRANHSGYIQRLDSEATTFFFTNFPDDVQAMDLWPCFARFGRVGEVYIPTKVDKQGKRINLSKFKRKVDANQKAELHHIGDGAKRTQGGITFKEVIKQGEILGAGEGTTSGVSHLAVRSGTEVVWEVEVEGERSANLEGAYVGYLVDDLDAQTMQNNFRMGGYESLMVTVLGYKTVLLWSVKKEEVKEVVETVGWWCTLFEKVIPWSPELVTNHKVTWLRCFGVPIHAWGNDIFRAMAFKFGRFIEVDEITKQFKRCDMARIKVVTSEKKVIDASMAVKVLGRRFDIRVIEETGGGLENGDIFRKRGSVWQSEKSSRVSVDGGSNVAAAEVLSETGSDVDVSESCQVLLELEAHGGSRSATNDSTRDLGYTECEMAGNIPLSLGKFGELVEPLVNYDRDNGEDVAKQPHVYEDVGDGVGGPTCVEGVSAPSKKVSGPMVLRTRKGDINVCGSLPITPSIKPGVHLVVGTGLGRKALLADTSSKVSSRRLSRNSTPGNHLNSHNLPFNKIHKLPGAVHSLARQLRKKNKIKKHLKKHGSKRSDAGLEVSDSIHNSEVSPSQIHATNDTSEIELEVSGSGGKETIGY
ncbi:hypothetical protein TSUD_260030 [Trifolium subterraneum]|uniref:Uncharacterized protein n=1 Tax=Trifolium subterraneum TaxID=3900 RepID=A0A2Z6N2G7_TRISU|nr:hypothetical protein TSUD_260030 [Trifolium subterraneum]